MGNKPVDENDAFWRDFSEFKNNFGNGGDVGNGGAVSSGGGAVMGGGAGAPFEDESTGSMWKMPIQIALAAMFAAMPISIWLYISDDFDDIIANGRQTLLKRDTNTVGDKLDASLQRLKTPDSSVASSSSSSTIKSSTQPSSTVTASADTALDHAAKHTNANYVCPMHPSVITSDSSASCPICGMKIGRASCRGRG